MCAGDLPPHSVPLPPWRRHSPKSSLRLGGRGDSDEKKRLVLLFLLLHFESGESGADEDGDEKERARGRTHGEKRRGRVGFSSSFFFSPSTSSSFRPSFFRHLLSIYPSQLHSGEEGKTGDETDREGREGGKLVDIKAIWSLFLLPPPKTPRHHQKKRARDRFIVSGSLGTCPVVVVSDSPPPSSPLQHTGRCYIPPFPPPSHFPQIGTRNDVSDRENREVVSERKVRQQVTLFPPSLEIPIFAAARGEASAATRAESANLPLPSSSHFFLFLGVDGKALFCEKRGA